VKGMSISVYKILSTDSEEWNNYLLRFPIIQQDIYFTREYYELYEKNGDGKGILYVYENNEKVAIYPFLLKEIEGYGLGEKYYDIETAYGYGGPLTNSYDVKFIRGFEKSFLTYCKESKIVAEFIRFHPLISNQQIFKNKLKVLHNRDSVYIDLSKGIDKVWQYDFKSQNRNRIRKAKKMGLVFEKSDDYETFKDIYTKTMDKVKADDYYYFNNDYYNAMSYNNKFTLFNVKYEDTIIASTIFMSYGKFFHYHLCGSLKEYLKFAPVNLLIWEISKIACENGASYFHLGGGVGDNSDDSLFKFKTTFSKEISRFYIGERIHNSEIYDYLIGEWERKNNKKAKLVLQYRY
jgi:hypothetical protein